MPYRSQLLMLAMLSLLLQAESCWYPGPGGLLGAGEDDGNIIDDPVYTAEYYDHVAATLDTPFAIDEHSARAQELWDVIQPYVEAEEAPYTTLESYGAFEASVTGNDGLHKAIELGILDEAQANLVCSARQARDAAIQVDAFDSEEFSKLRG